MAPDIVKDQDRILLTAVAARKYLIRQYDYDHDDGDVDEHEQAMLAGKRRQSQRQQLQQQRQKQQFTSPSSDAGGGGAGFRLPSFAAAKNSSFVRGAADIAAKLHLPGFHKGRDAFEGDQEITGEYCNPSLSFLVTSGYIWSFHLSPCPCVPDSTRLEWMMIRSYCHPDA